MVDRSEYVGDDGKTPHTLRNRDRQPGMPLHQPPFKSASARRTSLMLTGDQTGMSDTDNGDTMHGDPAPNRRAARPGRRG